MALRELKRMRLFEVIFFVGNILRQTDETAKNWA